MVGQHVACLSTRVSSRARLASSICIAIGCFLVPRFTRYHPPPLRSNPEPPHARDKYTGMHRSLVRSNPAPDIPPRLCRSSAAFYRTGGQVPGGLKLALAETARLESYIESQVGTRTIELNS